MKVYILAGILGLSSCVTNSSQKAENIEIKPSHIGGIYLETPRDYDEDYDSPSQKPSVVSYNYNYREVSLDTALGVRLNECINVTILPNTKAPNQYYNQLGVKIELSEEARMKLMNLSLKKKFSNLYLVLGTEAVAHLYVEGTLAGTDITLYSEDKDDDARIKNFFENN